jgi:photosystem II stability/assembly factor-like uncharacterized protein
MIAGADIFRMMRCAVFTAAAILFFSTPTFPQQSLAPDATRGSNLRGVSAVNDTVVWVSGSKGTIARTVDGGNKWERITPPQGAEAFDFRDVEAFSDKIAYVMSVGPGEQSRIWKTRDGGKTWQQQYTNKSPDFFLDSLACWSEKRCVALSDPVDGKFLVLITEDGEHWRELPRDHMPAAAVEKRTGSDGKQEQIKEGAFAASGTAITVLGRNIWFGTGGPEARVFHSADRGKTWTVVGTPIMHGEASQGIFSITFRDAKHGVIVGGDYKQPDKTGANAAFTDDGGKTWMLSKSQPNGYRSAVVFLREWLRAMKEQGSNWKRFYAVGLNGTDDSQDDGLNWAPMKTSGCNAESTKRPHGWCVGLNGAINQLPPAAVTVE